LGGVLAGEKEKYAKLNDPGECLRHHCVSEVVKLGKVSENLAIAATRVHKQREKKGEKPFKTRPSGVPQRKQEKINMQL